MDWKLQEAVCQLLTSRENDTFAGLGQYVIHEAANYCAAQDYDYQREDKTGKVGTGLNGSDYLADHEWLGKADSSS